MAEILYGKPVVASIKEDIISRTNALKEKGFPTKLAIIRSGDREDDIAYERRIIKLCESMGIEHDSIVADRDISHDDFIDIVKKADSSSDVQGMLIFRPLPDQIDEEDLEKCISLDKDLDRMHSDNLKFLFRDMAMGYAPATPEAVIEILKFYGIDMDGANVVIVNRSLVLGRPLSLLFLGQNSTVTICHSHTKDLPSITRNADIVVTGIGGAEYFGPEYFREGQIVIDVGINFKDGKMTGDVDFEKVSETVRAITPVPGGIGGITSMILLRHLIDAAEKASEETQQKTV